MATFATWLIGISPLGMYHAALSDMNPLSLLSAVVVLDSSYEGWTLLDRGTEDDRIVRHHVVFERLFSAPPVVHVGIAGMDVSNEGNVRLRVRALDITSNSPWMRGQPHIGLASAMRRTRARTWLSVGGRPGGLLERQVQTCERRRDANAPRCRA